MSALFWIGAARILIVVTRYALALLAVHQTTRWAAFPSFVRLDDEEKNALLAPVREFSPAPRER